MTFAVGIPLFLRSSLIAFTNGESPIFRSFAEKPCSVNPFSHERTSRAHHSSRQAFFPLEGHDTRRFFGCLPSKPPVHRPVYRNIGKPCRLKTPTNTSIEAHSSNETLRAHQRDTSVFPRFLYLPGQLSPTVFALVYTNARRHDELIKLTSACFCRMIHNVLHAASFSPAIFLLSIFLSFFLSFLVRFHLLRFAVRIAFSRVFRSRTRKRDRVSGTTTCTTVTGHFFSNYAMKSENYLPNRFCR